MICYRCGGQSLVLAALSPYERRLYGQCEITLRVCQDCGLEQNHWPGAEIVPPAEAAMKAPERSF